MLVVVSLILVVVLGILSCAIAIACDVRAIREKLESAPPGLAREPADCKYTGTEPVQAYFEMPETGTATLEAVGSSGHIDPHTHHSLARHFVVWEWRNGAWNVRPGDSSNSDSGSPPRFPGAFEGDHVKKWTPESSR